MATYNFAVRQGNTGIVNNPSGLVLLIKQADGTLADISGDDFYFTTAAHNGVIVSLNTFDGSAQKEAVTSQVTFPISLSFARSYPPTALVPYEVERRTPSGEQHTILSGIITVLRGNNYD